MERYRALVEHAVTGWWLLAFAFAGTPDSGDGGGSRPLRNASPGAFPSDATAPVGRPIVVTHSESTGEGVPESESAARRALLHLVDAPESGEARLELARAWLADPQHRDAGVQVARGLLADPTHREAARDLLTDVLRSTPARRAWVGVYTEVARAHDGSVVASSGTPKKVTKKKKATKARHAAAATSPVGKELARKGQAARSERIPRRPAWKYIPSVQAEKALLERPSDPNAARAVSELRVASGRSGEALAPLRVALAAWPDDLRLLRVLAGIVTTEGDPTGEARAFFYRGIASATTPRRVQQVSEVLGDVLVAVGEHAKRAGSAESAALAYAEAWAVAPGAPNVVLGGAGLAWQQGRLPAAAALYAAHLAADPADHDTRVAGIRLALAMSDDARARDLILGLPDTHPQAAGLREELAQQDRLRAVRAALEGGASAEALEIARAGGARWPSEPAWVRLEAEALGQGGRHTEALAAWERAQALAPADPWASIGACHTLLALGRMEEAEHRVDALVGGGDAATTRGASAGGTHEPALLAAAGGVRARIARDRSGLALAAGDLVGARREAQRALDLEPSAWSILSLASVELRAGANDAALARYEEAAKAAPNLAEAAVGRASTLAVLGRGDEGVALLRAFVDRGASASAKVALRALDVQVAVREGITASNRGDVPAARLRLRDALARVGDDVDLYSALVSVELADGDADAAWTAAGQAFKVAPTPWARQSLVDAARASGHSDAAFAQLDALVANDPTVVPDRERARLDALLQAAEARGWPANLLALSRAESEVASGRVLAEDGWRRVGDAWLAAGQVRPAIASYTRALALNERDPVVRAEVLVTRAQARLALGQLTAARDDLAAAIAVVASAPPSTEGLAGADLVRVRARILALDVALAAREPAEARAKLGEIDRGSARWVGMAVGERAPRVEALEGPTVDLGPVILSRGGAAGTTGLVAELLPVRFQSSLRRGARWYVQGMPVRLADDDGTDQGGTLIAGVETAPARAWSAQAAVGTSPVGFEGGVYPTWTGRAAWRATPYLNVAIETGRAPRTDTRASWAGTVFPSTLQRYGRVSQLWAGAEASVGNGAWDAGLLARGGFVEGIGVEPNPMGEGTWWLGHAWHPGRMDVRLGADGIAMKYDRREDGLVPGEGGYFSPPFFGTALARLDVAAHGGRWGACAGVGGGARYQQGDASNLFDTVGVSSTLTGHLGAAWELPARWRVVGDLRGEQASTGWRQTSAVLRVAWGAQPPASAAAPTPLGAPGFLLPADSTLCTTGASR